MNIDLGNINLELFDICYMTIWFLISGIMFLFYTSKLKKEIKILKRQYEKKSIGADDSSLRVNALENKIKTLEAALKKQMEK